MSKISEQKIKKATKILSILFFAVSLSQKAYCNNHSCNDSLAVVFAGLLGFYLSPAGLCWLANPCLLVSWLKIDYNFKLSLWASAGATLLALSFLFYPTIFDNEDSISSRIISYQLGYWLWLSSNLIMLIGNLLTVLLCKIGYFIKT